MHNPPQPRRSGHYRKGMSREHHPVATVRVDSKSAQVARLLTRHTDLCDEARALQDPQYAASIITDLEQVEEQIRALGFRVPARSYRVSGPVDEKE